MLWGLVFLIVDVLLYRVGRLKEVQNLVSILLLLESKHIAFLLLHDYFLSL